MNTIPFTESNNPFGGARLDVPLERRVSDLEDVAALNRLVTAYTAYCDPYDAEGFASLFTEDGVWESGEYGTKVGRDAIREFISGVDSEIIWAAHHVTNSDVTLSEDGQSAVGRWYLLVMEDIRNADGSVDGYLAMANYNNQFVKQGGRWYLKHCKPTGKAEKVLHGGWNQND